MSEFEYGDCPHCGKNLYGKIVLVEVTLTDFDEETTFSEEFKTVAIHSGSKPGALFVPDTPPMDLSMWICDWCNKDITGFIDGYYDVGWF